ncbi:MAG: Fe-S cluster assembly ATPase SufC [Chlorobi bacterium]|nr:Fe-S cluster assembly ATPase SufC [Chlorobiota bacterium]
MLEIKNLHASVDGKEILKGVDLTIYPGEVHAIMGPNGTGKSTLAYILAGKDGYEVTQGEILFRGKNLLDLSPEERAWEGLFLGFQYPVEIPGVRMSQFMKAAVDARRKSRGLPPMRPSEFLAHYQAKQELVGLPPQIRNRAVNEGFSGGEKKRNEIFQMAVLEPVLAVLDETDSGLDIDALRAVAEGINRLRTRDNAFLLITHYQRMLDHIRPDRVHIMHDGKIVRSGGPELAERLEAEGYAGLTEKKE